MPYWDDAAEGWLASSHAFNRTARPVSEWMLDAAGLAPGHSVLELAAGTGDTGLLAARRVVPGGTVEITDASAQMVRAAERLGHQQRVHNVRYRTVRAQRLEYDPRTFDALFCRFGYMLIDDPLDAFREARRVLQPNGRLALAVWDAIEHNPWIDAIRAVLMDEGLVAGRPVARPGPFALDSQTRLRELLTAAGFRTLAVRSLDLEHRAASIETWWQQLLGRSADTARTVRALRPSRQLAIRDAAFERFVQPDGSICVPARAIVAATRS